MYVCGCGVFAHECKSEVSDPLGLELQAVVNCSVWELGIELWSLRTVSQSSLQPPK